MSSTLRAHRRIVVVGTSGAGKTTFARGLAASLAYPHIELDVCHWGPNWTVRVDFVERVNRAIQADTWVLDGNYPAVREMVWARATAIVWLDFSFPVVFARALCRTLRRIVAREVVPGGRETWRALVARDGIPRWVLKTYRQRRRLLRRLMTMRRYPALHNPLPLLIALLVASASACSSPHPPHPPAQPDATHSSTSEDHPARTSSAPNDSPATLRHQPQSPPLPGVVRSSIRVGPQEFSLHLPRDVPPPLPSVLVFHSAMGRTDSVLNWCDRLAQQGFAAIAFDFFEGAVARSPAESKTLRNAANARANQLQTAIELSYEEIHVDPRLQANDRFLLGWSFGAAWATYSIELLPDLKGVVAYYGQAFTDNPRLFDTLHAPVLLIGGELDSAPPPERLRTIVTQLVANGKHATLKLFPAGHGFAEATHPGHNPNVAERAWDATIAFLREHTATDSGSASTADGT